MQQSNQSPFILVGIGGAIALAQARMAVSTASACLRKLSPLVYSHNKSQASLRSGIVNNSDDLVWIALEKLSRVHEAGQVPVWMSDKLQFVVALASIQGEATN
ncbi:MAG TPA: hypothetical protein VK582_01225 [Pyrinomonadaceae bacterium]|nr:hypothetical protein [Pyrinomonadaceae bacterium]